ncbi:MAG: hypothetical protein ABJJ44_19540 [Paraglaciecola sp.]|uniref:hypothetical protein n=1 Tax=Paraglaciecola sp. TaxID=1920173 RepID=UPI003299D4E7
MKADAINLEKFILNLSNDERDYFFQDLPRWVGVSQQNGESLFIEPWAMRQKFKSVIH